MTREVVSVEIPFEGSIGEAEKELAQLETLAGQARVISSHANNLNTNLPEKTIRDLGYPDTVIKHTWRFVGVPQNLSIFLNLVEESDILKIADVSTNR